MKYFQSTITFLSFTITLGIALSSSAAQPENLERTAKDLEIMSHILSTSIEPKNNNRMFGWHRNIEARYLAGQGVVFTIPIPTGFNFSRIITDGEVNNFVLERELVEAASGGAPLPPLPATPVAAPTGSTHILSIIGSGSHSEEQRQLMEEQRGAVLQKERAIRESQREIRELQRSMRETDKNTDELSKKIKEVEKIMAANASDLEKVQKNYSEFMAKIEKESQAQREELSNQVANQTVQALCDYGSTLKSLQNNEHITLVLENVAQDQDKYFVFTFKEVSQCTSADKLLKSAVVYQM